jgi:hypothetical protein
MILHEHLKHSVVTPLSFSQLGTDVSEIDIHGDKVHSHLPFDIE